MLPRLAALPARIVGAREALAAGSGDPGLGALLDDTNTALESLRELTRGVFPTQLARAGLAPALRSRLGQAGLASILEVEDSAAGGRFEPRVEMAVYFCCAEAAPAMSDDSKATLQAGEAELWLRLRGLEPDRIDLQAIADRVAAVEGSLQVREREVTVWIPTVQPGSRKDEVAVAQASDSRSGPKAALGT